MKKRALLNDIEQLNAIMENNDCLLYGAGRVAKTMVQYAAGKKYGIKKILVSQRTGNPSVIMGIPVCVPESSGEDVENSILIVCAMENLHNGIEEFLTGFSFKKIYFVSNELYGKVVYKIGNYELDELYEIQKSNQMLKNSILNSILRFVPRPCLEYMILNIVDHCNLRCKGCDHFACIAEPYVVPYETIHSDLKRMAELFHGDYIMKIAVMGGEPLLHPELTGILRDVRENFPHTTIRLTTNGLLLLKQGEEFWRVCRENRIVIVNTKYPVNLDFAGMKKKALDEGVEFMHFEGTGDNVLKTIFKKTINLKGDSNPAESFANCHISNYGNFLMEGKLYGCPFACQSYRIFNKKFNQNLRMTERDYLDIYKVKDMQEILDFASEPKYYCRYCTDLSPRFPWEQSRQDIHEWID